MMKFLFILLFCSINSYAYTCNVAFEPTQFQSKYLVKSVGNKNDKTGEKERWDYFIYPDGSLILVKQSECFMSEFFVDYYFSEKNDVNRILKNYKSILEQIFISRDLIVRHGDLYGYVLNKLQEKESNKKFIIERIKRDDSVESDFYFTTISDKPSVYKYKLTTYVGIGGL